MIDVEEVRKRLQNMVDDAGSVRALSAKTGVSYQYINMVVMGRQEPGKAILKFMGLKKIVGYEKANGKE